MQSIVADPVPAIKVRPDPETGEGLRFIWLELTNACNLTCAHCYAESGPNPAQADALKTEDYMRLLGEAAELGCRSVQFVGGEATLHPGLPALIAHARALGFEQVEVYTNALRLTDDLLSVFVRHRVNIAASVYADEPGIHDAVTGRKGSHGRTIANLRRILAQGLDVRVGCVAMEVNEARVDETRSFLRGLGIENFGVDKVRGVGRGKTDPDSAADMQALCGACWQGSLCVAPDGRTSSCVMSKAWPVGSVLERSLADIVESKRLRAIRARIKEEVWRPKSEDICRVTNPECRPIGCHPCIPYNCNPTPVARA